jgi:hypothetical protein
MPSTPPDPGPPRSAAAVDEEIRALLTATGGWLWGPTRARYEQLRDEWVEAVRGEITTAA